ncbi:MAG: PKD domain-containing protein [candidate division Zixibacteria bacterium]|nr:PKD domain-containing protein [candidate division Zixibacteria bacterium]
MKKLTITIVLILLSSSTWAQNLVVGPESVIFDEVRNRYIVANWDGGTISLIDSLGRHSFLATGINEPGGLCISGDTLWFAADSPNRVLALDIITGDTLLVSLPTISTPNDFFDSIMLDTSGNAYITVCQGGNIYGQIYKMNISTLTWTIFADAGIQFPQTMRFIPEDNSLIMNSAANGPARISKINIATSTVTHLVESSLDLTMDGVTFDDFGNTYVSSWGYNAAYRFNSTYDDPPEMIANGFNGPTSLYYNKYDNVLAVPDISNNRIVFIPMYVDFDTDVIYGWPPFDVNFTANSDLTVDSWSWNFDDGQISAAQSPTHSFTQPGVHIVNLEINAEDKTINRKHYIAALADTLYSPNISIFDGNTILEIDIFASNAVPVDYFNIPIEYSAEFSLVYDSFNITGCRTEYFDKIQELHADGSNNRRYINLSIQDQSLPILEPGIGPVLKLYFTVPSSISSGKSITINVDGYSTDYSDKLPFFDSPFTGDRYSPEIKEGAITILSCGDVDLTGTVDILDIVFLINNLYKSGPAPNPIELADVNNDVLINILDIVYLINSIYKSGPVPVCSWKGGASNDFAIQ